MAFSNYDVINDRRLLESIIVDYILKSSTKDVNLIDDESYRTSTTNLLSDIFVKNVDEGTIDEVFYHIGANMIDANMIDANMIDVDLRLKCKHMAEFYYEIYVLFNKIKMILLVIDKLTQSAVDDLEEDAFEDDDFEDDDFEMKINKLHLLEINFYNILGEVFIKRDVHMINNTITLERILEIGEIIDLEINVFSGEFNNIKKI